MRKIEKALIPALIVELVSQKVKKNINMFMGTNNQYEEFLDTVELQVIASEDSENFYWSINDQKWRNKWWFDK